MEIKKIPLKSATKNTAIIDIRDIKKVIKAFTDNWLVILSCLLASMLAAYLYSYKLPRVYGTKMQLLLATTETYSYQEQLFQGLGLFSPNYEKMSNEMRVITSTDLLSQTVNKLNASISYYIVGKVNTKEVFSDTPFLVEARVYDNAYYEFPFTLKFVDANTYEISFDEKGEKVSQKHKFGEPMINNQYYLLINKTGAVTPVTYASFPVYQFMVHNSQTLMYQFKNSLSASNVEYTGILELSLEDQNPERAVRFLDTLGRVYIDNSLKTKFQINSNTIVFIDKQIGEIHEILDSLESMLDNFKDTKDIINLSKEEATYYEELTNFEARRRGLELQLKGSAYLKNYIVSNMNKELLPPFAYIDNADAYLTKAVTQLYDYQVKINSMLFSSTDKSTTIKETEYNIELLRNDILKYIANSDKAIQEKIQSVDDEIAFYESRLKGVPRNQRQMLNINRKIGVNEKMYLYLLEKRAETIIAKAGIISDISIIESPHSIGVVKPELSKIYYSFVSFGLLIAALIIALRMIFFGSIESLEDLREQTNLPVVGEVFHAKEGRSSYLVVDAHPKSFIAESFRGLRTNLEYLAPDVKNKVILITSNSPSAGKTFCSVNLGSILAKGGKRVLLLELDLHKPKIHKALNLKNDLGISTILIGKCQPAEAIVSTQIENLDVILSGPTPPNASELILSDHMSALFEFARTRYDYVIIDTPPMGIISDALVLMKYSNINLYVINSTRGSHEGLQFAHSVLENNKLNGSFAFILNNVRPKFSRYYYKGYKYNYGYGYVQK